MRAIARQCLEAADQAFAEEIGALTGGESSVWRAARACVARDPLLFVPLWEEEPAELPAELAALAGVHAVRLRLMHRWLNPLDVGDDRVGPARALLGCVFRWELAAFEAFSSASIEPSVAAAAELRYRTQRLLHPPPPSLVDVPAEDRVQSTPDAVNALVGRWESARASRGLWRYLRDKLAQNLGFFRWGFSMPVYAFRRRLVDRRLPASARRDRAVAETFSAIEAVGPVVDNFVFGGRITRRDPAPAAVSDLAFLFMQLADEVVDNCAKRLPPRDLAVLVEELYPRESRAHAFTPLEEMDAATLRRVGVDPDASLEKYSMGIGQMLEILEDLRVAMRSAVDALPVERREMVRDDLSAFFRHCFATFLDELYLPGLGDGAMDRLPLCDTAWHFHRKNNEVMMRWLELRALAHGLDTDDHAESIQEWGYVLANFQVFDDLKDVFVDLGMQPNYPLQIAATRFPSEYEWLRENADRLGPTISVNGVREVGIHASRTVMHCMRLSRLMALSAFGWLTVYVWDQRWQRSWTSLFGSFNRPDDGAPPARDSLGGDEAMDAFFSLLARTRGLAEEMGVSDEYLAYVLDLFAYDRRGAVYAALLPSPRAIYRYHFLRMLIPSTEKTSMLRRLLRRHRGAARSALASEWADTALAAVQRTWLRETLGLAADLPVSVAAKPGA